VSGLSPLVPLVVPVGDEATVGRAATVPVERIAALRTFPAVASLEGDGSR
jgi:hypothetical protein